MYTEFYNLREKPFDLTPSPRFLCLGEGHREALALLTYGVMERKGFILLTGEVGTGKTTIVQALLSSLDSDIEYIYLSNPLFSPKDFMNYLAFTAFKQRSNFKTKAEFLIEFEEFLKERLKNQKILILIIDEAQNLSFRLLEEIRLLSNMETADKKLINIFLVGQPELNDKLSQSRCRPLLQRIGIRYHIQPLDLEGTGQYMAKRLRVAGCDDLHSIFPKNAIKAIYQYSQGYPRMINVLADNALLLGYSTGKRKITPAMVKECHQDLKPEEEILDTSKDAIEPHKIEQGVKTTSVAAWRWAAAVIFVLAVAIFMLGTGQDILGNLSSPIPSGLNNAPENIDKVTPKRVISVERNKVIKGQQDSLESIKEIVGKRKLKAETYESKSDGQDEHHVKALAMHEAEMQVGPDYVEPERDQSFSTTIIAKEGNTITELATKVYGLVNKSILDLLGEHNPDIGDVNWIHEGQKIFFPPLPHWEKEPSYTVHVASFEPFSYAQEMFQKLMEEGYDVYILPAFDSDKGKVFRVTLGNFKYPQKAQAYASKLKETGASNYSEMIRLR